MNARIGEVIVGDPEIIASELITTDRGLGVFTTPELKAIEATLLARGLYRGPEEVFFLIDAGFEGDVGKLHRHAAGGLVVHHTLKGSGIVSLLWARGDEAVGIYPSAADQAIATRDVEYAFSESAVLMFPTGAWHQVETPPNTNRFSVANFYYPR